MTMTQHRCIDSIEGTEGIDSRALYLYMVCQYPLYLQTLNFNDRDSHILGIERHPIASPTSFGTSSRYCYAASILDLQPLSLAHCIGPPFLWNDVYSHQLQLKRHPVLFSKVLWMSLALGIMVLWCTFTAFILKLSDICQTLCSRPELEPSQQSLSWFNTTSGLAQRLRAQFENHH